MFGNEIPPSPKVEDFVHGRFYKLIATGDFGGMFRTPRLFLSHFHCPRNAHVHLRHVYLAFLSLINSWTFLRSPPARTNIQGIVSSIILFSYHTSVLTFVSVLFSYQNPFYIQFIFSRFWTKMRINNFHF